MDVPQVHPPLSALDQLAAGLWAVYLRDRSRIDVRKALWEIYAPLAQRGARAESRNNWRSHRAAGLDESDIEQMAMIGLLKLIETFEPGEGGEARSFAKYASLLIRLRVKESIRTGSRISRHGWRMGCRQRVNNEALDSGIEAEGDAPTVPAELNEFRERMLEGLEDDRERAVFQLKFLAGLSSEQVGRYIGKSEATVCLMLKRQIVPKILRAFPDAPAGAERRVLKAFRSNGVS